MPQWCHKDWETCKLQGQECKGKYAVKRAFIAGERWIERGPNWCREDTEPDTSSRGPDGMCCMHFRLGHVAGWTFPWQKQENNLPNKPQSVERRIKLNSGVLKLINGSKSALFISGRSTCWIPQVDIKVMWLFSPSEPLVLKTWVWPTSQKLWQRSPNVLSYCQSSSGLRVSSVDMESLTAAAHGWLTTSCLFLLDCAAVGRSVDVPLPPLTHSAAVVLCSPRLQLSDLQGRRELAGFGHVEDGTLCISTIHNGDVAWKPRGAQYNLNGGNIQASVEVGWNVHVGPQVKQIIVFPRR